MSYQDLGNGRKLERAAKAIEHELNQRAQSQRAQPQRGAPPPLPHAPTSSLDSGNVDWVVARPDSNSQRRPSAPPAGYTRCEECPVNAIKQAVRRCCGVAGCDPQQAAETTAEVIKLVAHVNQRNNTHRTSPSHSSGLAGRKVGMGRHSSNRTMTIRWKEVPYTYKVWFFTSLAVGIVICL